MNEGRTRVGLQDAVVVAILCVFVLTTAGALSMGGRLHAKTLMCQKNLRSIGQALNLYVEHYDGKLLTLEKGAPTPYYSQHYYLVKRAVADQEPDPSKYKWINMGCLFGAGLIADGRTLYCPAAAGGLNEYTSYASSSPWGTLPQYLPGTTTPIPTNASNQWLRTRRGYVYWPQDLATVTDISRFVGSVDPSGFWLYQQGYPMPATLVANLDLNKAIVVDGVFHAEGQYKVNALFWDGSVVYQDVPTGADGKKLYNDSTMQMPDSATPGNDWRRVSMAEWMWRLQR